MLPATAQKRAEAKFKSNCNDELVRSGQMVEYRATSPYLGTTFGYNPERPPLL